MIKQPGHLTLIALRHSTKHPIQSLLLVLGVALGVAMIVAIDLANSSASRAFALSTDSIAGKATHQIIGAANDIPSTLYQTLRTQSGLQNIAPVVTGLVLVPQAEDLPLQVLGVDPFAEAPFRNYLNAGNSNLSLDIFTTLLTEPNTVIIAQSLGERLGITTGDSLTILANSQQQKLTVIALLQPKDDLSRQALESLILTDISTAQELLGKVGQLSHIDLILSPEDDLITITSLLPENAQLQRASVRNETLDQMTAAFELNLSALSLLGLMVGMFLIYNTISFSVVQRRRTLGVLRCLGVIRQEIFGLVLTEAIILSTIGTFIGLGLGILLGRSLVGLVSQTINDLFFTLTVQTTSLQPLTLYKGVLAGLGAGLVAAFIPAWEATQVQPVSTLKRSQEESRFQKFIPALTVFGGVLILFGAGLLIWPSEAVTVSFAALLLILLGIAFVTPLLTKLILKLIQPVLTKSIGIIGTMAGRDVIRALSRTSITIAALMISVAVIIGVGVMVASFRSTIFIWLNNILEADIYISPVGQAMRLDNPVDPEFIEAIKTYPGIAQVSLGRRTTVLSPDYGQATLQAYSPADIQTRRTFLWKAPNPSAEISLLDQGHLFISEVFARRHGFPLNQPSNITLLTATGPQTFEINGIFYDYGSTTGFMVMSLETYQIYWQDSIISNVALYLAPETDDNALVEQLTTDYGGLYQLSVVSNRLVKEQALNIFDRTFTITAALRLLATIVAFIGVLSALMSLQLERTRELGTLRANGMTLSQLWGLTLLETALIGLIAGLIALPTGLILSVILTYAINLRSFGWSLQLQPDIQVLSVAFLVAIGAALLAGIYPALRLSKMKIAIALREE